MSNQEAYDLAYDIFYNEGFRGDQLDELIRQQIEEV